MEDKIIDFRKLAENQINSDHGDLAKEVLSICDTLDSKMHLFFQKTEELLKKSSTYKPGDSIKWYNNRTGIHSKGEVRGIKPRHDGGVCWVVEVKEINGKEINFRHIVYVGVKEEEIIEI